MREEKLENLHASASDPPRPNSSYIQAPASTDRGQWLQISDNPYFTAGLGLATLGALLATFRKGVTHGAKMLKHRLLVDVEINVKDESFPWLLQWMTAHHRAQLHTKADAISETKSAVNSRLFHALWRRLRPGLHQLSIKTDKFEQPNGSVRTRFSLVPGPGRHLIYYKGNFVMVQRTRETKSMDLARGLPWETINMTTLYSQRHIIEEILIDAHRLLSQETAGKMLIYTSRSTSWEQFGEPRRKRPLESVILDVGVKERILDDVKDFLGSSNWYLERGIPYRRGYLLHGPPGSGKSSFIQALAGELDYSIAMLNLSERGLTDDRLQHLLSTLPRRTLVLLEDADAAFSNRRSQVDSDGYRGANVTFSGLLNALDGVASAEERMLFLTTNHVDRLDSALVRPGRVDVVVELGSATRFQASSLWDRFYGHIDSNGIYRAQFLAQLEAFSHIASQTESSRVKTVGLSTAALQGIFLTNKMDMNGAIKTINLLRPDAPLPKSDHLSSP